MVDNVSEATLKVHVEGEDKVAALNAALASLGKTARTEASRSASDIRGIGAGAVDRAATREARKRSEAITAAAVPGRILAMQTAKRAQEQADKVAEAAASAAKNQAAQVTAAAAKGVAQGATAAKAVAKDAGAVTRSVVQKTAAQTAEVTAAAAKQLAQGAPAARRSVAQALKSVLSNVGTSVGSGLRNALQAANVFGGQLVSVIGRGVSVSVSALRTFGSTMGSLVWRGVSASLSAAKTFAATIGSIIGKGLLGAARITVQTIGTVARGFAAAGLGIARLGAGIIKATGVIGLLAGALGGLVGVGALAAAGMKTLTFSIRAAKDEAEEAFKSFSRARRLRTTWDNASDLQEVGKILFRDAAEKVEDGINKMREKVRLGRSEEGDKQVFGRLGLTARTLARFEKELGKAEGTDSRGATAVDFAERFVKRLETQQARIDKMGPGRSRDVAVARQRQFFLDLEKVFGTDFADAVARSSSEGIKKAFQTQAVAGATGPQADAKTRLKQAQDLILAQASLDRTFAELKSRIAVDVQPAVTNLMWAFTNLVQAVGPNIADSISDLAKRGIGSLTEQLNKIDAKQVESWGKAIFDMAGSLGSALPDIVGALNTFVDALKTIAEAIKAVSKFLSGENAPEGKKPVAVTESPFKWFRNTLEKGLENSTGATSANVQQQLPQLDFSLEEGAQRIKESSQSIVDAAAHAKQRLEMADFSQAASAAGAAMAAAFRQGIAGATIAPPSWLGALRVSMPGGAAQPQRVTAFPPTGRDAPSAN